MFQCCNTLEHVFGLTVTIKTNFEFVPKALSNNTSVEPILTSIWAKREREESESTALNNDPCDGFGAMIG